MSAIRPQTPSRALWALLTRRGSKSVRIDNRYTEAYGPHEVMLNIDGMNICTKTMITCDEDLAGQIYMLKRRTKSEIHLPLCYGGGGCHASGDRSRRVCTRNGHKWKEDTTAWVVGHGSRLECNTN